MMATVGIRREDHSHWERRVPIVPADVERLRLSCGIGFLVEPSAYRIYDDEAYRRVGAEITQDLAPAQVIVGVKEIPPEKLLPGKTYAFFAHVIKGQRHNMPLLARLLELECTLIDYERITDASGRRLVLFGRQAGQAGLVDSLSLLGARLRREGRDTPLAELRLTHQYEDLEDVKKHLLAVGERIRKEGLGIADAPLVVGFMGAGNVSEGAQSVFDLLPYEEVAPGDLSEVSARSAGVQDRLLKVVFEKRHLAEPQEVGKPFDVTEYQVHPERYRGRLIRYLPYVTVLVNGTFWTPDFPRFFTRQEARALWEAGERKLRVIGDITCDVDGAIELTYKATHLDHPTYVYDPASDSWSDEPDHDGIVILAVDNLPCELPRSASDQFSNALHDFLPAIARADYARPFAELELPSEICRATVTHRGKLTPDYRYLEKYLGRE